MRLKDRLRRALYSVLHSRGDRFFCVYCGKSYARFLQAGRDKPVLKRLDVVGAGKRRNGRCPNCMSNDRSRLLYLYLTKRTRVFSEPTRVLHFAPDPHLGLALFDSDLVDYVCGDIEIGGKEYLGARYMDVCEIPFPDSSFDVVLCNHVLEYVPDDALAFREMHRVLKPGGFAILQVPIALAREETYEVEGLELNRRNTITHYGHSGNRRLYGLDYGKRITNAGFTLERHNVFEERWVPDPERHGLDPREDLYVAKRS